MDGYRESLLLRCVLAAASLACCPAALAQTQVLAVVPGSSEHSASLTHAIPEARNTEPEPLASRTTLRVAETPRVTVTIGAGGVSGGSRRFAQRSTTAGNALVVDFSATPVFLSSRRYAALPTGLPISSVRLTSGFGTRRHPIFGGYRFHSGVDLAAPTGSPLAATSEGVITRAAYTGGYGLLVAIDHGGGVETRYGHLSGVNVSVGQSVKTGQIIGFVGSTGESTGPHVHYEVRVDGRAVNPL